MDNLDATDIFEKEHTELEMKYKALILKVYQRN